MRYWLTLLVLCLSFGTVRASEVVTIRSGEHPGFTRLVLYFGNPVAWQLGRVPEGYALRVDPAVASYDTSGIFDFIPRSRIPDVRPEATGLILPVTCRCHAVAFEHAPGILVIDIKDGPPPRQSLFEASLAPLAAQAKEGVGAILPGNAPPDTGTAAPNADDVTAAAAKLVFPVTFPASPVLSVLAAGEADPLLPDKTPDPLRARLAEQLGRAVSQGLVTAAKQSPAPIVTASPDGEVPGAAPPQENFRLRTALDLALEATGTSVEGPGVCLPSALFDVFQSAQADPAPLLLARARGALMEDLVTPDPAAVLRLAQTYAYLGFGAEIRNLLTQFPQQGDAARVLLDLSGPLDAPGVAIGSGLQDQVSCDTAGALWGLLAYGPEVPSRTVNDQAIQRAVSALPVHLRRHLVPAVSEKLRTLGLTEAAGRVRDTLARVSDDPDGELLIETAQAIAPEAVAPATLAGLARTATGNSEVAALAQAEVLRHDLRKSTPLSQARRDEITAQIHETKGTEAGAALLSAYVDALNAARMPKDALEFLVRSAGSDYAAPDQLAQLLDRTFGKLTETADDGTFLEVAVTFPPRILPVPLGVATSRQVADRLLALGFSTQAQAFEQDGPPPMDADRRIALARDALAQGRGMEALARVAQLDDPDSRALRAEALVAAGANREASALLEAAGDTPAAALQAWMGGDWASADRLLPDGARKALAVDLAAAQPGPTADPASAAGSKAPPNLKDNRELITTSEKLRATLATLLATSAASN